jgi:hypothetical protein
MLTRYLLLGVLLSLLCGCSWQSAEDAANEAELKKMFEDYENRKVYTSLSPEILASIADDDLEQAIVDYVVGKLKDGAQEEMVVAALPPGIRAFWLTWNVESEVNNGGFNQYYWNTGDRFSTQAVEAFQFFSAPEHARLMQEANAIRAQEAQAINQLKQAGTLEAFSESYKLSKLSPLDERFYELKEDLPALRIAKIRAAPESFSGN